MQIYPHYSEKTRGRHFQGPSGQRCPVHLMHNILGHCAVRHQAEMAAAVKLVLQAPDMTERPDGAWVSLSSALPS